jgi:hypothetical protein
MKKEQIEEIRKEIANLTEKLDRLEKQDEKPINYPPLGELSVKINKSAIYVSEKYMETLVVLNNLLCIRDEWNRIDGFENGNENGIGFSILNGISNMLITTKGSFYAFHFKDEPTAKLFLETFRPQLELIKELL